MFPVKSNTGAHGGGGQHSSLLIDFKTELAYLAGLERVVHRQNRLSDGAVRQGGIHLNVPHAAGGKGHSHEEFLTAKGIVYLPRTDKGICMISVDGVRNLKTISHIGDVHFQIAYVGTRVIKENLGNGIDLIKIHKEILVGSVRHIHGQFAGIDRSLMAVDRSEEHTSELQSRQYLVCRLLL